MSTFKKYMKIIQEVKDMEDLKPLHTGVNYIGLSSYFQQAGVMGYDKNNNTLDKKNKNAYYADYIKYIKDNIEDFKKKIIEKNSNKIKPENVSNLSIENIKKLNGVATEKDFDNELKKVMEGRKSGEISRDIMTTVKYGESLKKVDAYLDEILKNPKYKIGFFDKLGASITKLFGGDKKNAITALQDLAVINCKNSPGNKEYKKNVIERLFGGNENAFKNHHPSLISPSDWEKRM